jgi:hypothetical protein
MSRRRVLLVALMIGSSAVAQTESATHSDAATRIGHIPGNSRPLTYWSTAIIEYWPTGRASESQASEHRGSIRIGGRL